MIKLSKKASLPGFENYVENSVDVNLNKEDRFGQHLKNIERFVSYPVTDNQDVISKWAKASWRRLMAVEYSNSNEFYQVVLDYCSASGLVEPLVVDEKYFYRPTEEVNSNDQRFIHAFGIGVSSETNYIIKGAFDHNNLVFYIKSVERVCCKKLQSSVPGEHLPLNYYDIAMCLSYRDRVQSLHSNLLYEAKDQGFMIEFEEFNKVMSVFHMISRSCI